MENPLFTRNFKKVCSVFGLLFSKVNVLNFETHSSFLKVLFLFFLTELVFTTIGLASYLLY